jgi:DNA-binding NarL/FixJ family response regulator
MTKRKINIAIAEDHDLVLDGYAALLKNHPKLKVLILALNGKELVQQMANKKPDIILLDIEMPVMDGRETLRQVKKKYPATKIIVVTSHYHQSFMIDFIKNGACAFVPKNCKFAELEKTILKVNKDGVYFNEDVTKVLAKSLAEQNSGIENPLLKGQFTKTELKIVKLLCEQNTIKQTADAMLIEPKVVEWYLQKIFRKTNCKNLTALLIFSVENGLV